jgi:hypothetical protein
MIPRLSSSYSESPKAAFGHGMAFTRAMDEGRTQRVRMQLLLNPLFYSSCNAGVPSERRLAAASNSAGRRLVDGGQRLDWVANSTAGVEQWHRHLRRGPLCDGGRCGGVTVDMCVLLGDVDSEYYHPYDDWQKAVEIN